MDDQDFMDPPDGPPAFSPKPRGSGRLVIWFAQLHTMLWKNAVLARRNLKLTTMQIVFPVVFVFLLFLLGLVPKYGGPIGDQPVMNGTQVPLCIPRGKDAKCYSFMFGPSNDTVVQDIVSRVSDNNGFGKLYYLDGVDDPEWEKIPSGSVVGMKTWQELQDFLLKHQNFTQAVLFFNSTTGGDDTDSVGMSIFEERVETVFQQASSSVEQEEDDSFEGDAMRRYKQLTRPLEGIASSRAAIEQTTKTTTSKKSGSNPAVRRSSPLIASVLNSLSDSFEQFNGFLRANGRTLPPFFPEAKKASVRRSAFDMFDYDTNEPLDYKSTWNVKYELWFNSTCTNLLYNPSIDGSTYTSPIASCPDIRPQLQFAADCAIIEYLLDGSATEGVDCQISLQAATWVDLGVNDTVQSYGVLFFFCAMMFVFVVLIYQVAFEKDKNLKLGMQLMGLKESVFWVSWFITSLIVSIVAIICVMTMGYILQFAFFWQTHFFIVFITFFLFSFAMIGLSLMVSVIVGTAKAAISVGMFLYILGVVIQIFLGNQSFVEFVYTKDLLAANILRPIFLCYPPFSFAKIVLDISALSYNIGGEEGPGYGWSDLTKDQHYGNLTVQSDFESWGVLVFDAILYYFLAWYLSNVLPSDTSSGSYPWFFLTPSYWGLSGACRGGNDGVEYVSIGSRMSLVDGEGHEAIKIEGLKKIYHKYPFGIRSNGDVLAVNGLDLTIEEGELFCLLGHNGAGKTTTINMLTGLYAPTEGQILIFDKDIETDLEAVRSEIGICPQHDILWLEMTPEEHLYLFSRLKDLDPDDIPATVESTLNYVNLNRVRDHPASSFSGGMKRRLSVAISSIGDPSVIFMDEPTTGMDPKSRRQVWKMIEQLKTGRVIIMTTHSMEEAEMLSDRVGIMARGTLRCCGTSLHLKNNFGEGYRLSVFSSIERVEEAKQGIWGLLNKAELMTESGGQLLFSLQHCAHEDIVRAIESLEQRGEEGASALYQDWGISQAGLEEVFLKVTGHGTANQSNVIDYDDQ